MSLLKEVDFDELFDYNKIYKLLKKCKTKNLDKIIKDILFIFDYFENKNISKIKIDIMYINYVKKDNFKYFILSKFQLNYSVAFLIKDKSLYIYKINKTFIDNVYQFENEGFSILLD